MLAILVTDAIPTKSPMLSGMKRSVRQPQDGRDEWWRGDARDDPNDREDPDTDGDDPATEELDSERDSHQLAPVEVAVVGRGHDVARELPTWMAGHLLPDQSSDFGTAEGLCEGAIERARSAKGTTKGREDTARTTKAVEAVAKSEMRFERSSSMSEVMRLSLAVR